jgi:ABC transporter substrate binding protein
MKRREFITLLGGAATAWPLATRAQQAERVRRIAILMPFLPTNAEAQARVRAFREELRKRGWAAEVNAQFDERWTGDNMDLIRAAAANLVELKPDVIVAQGARVVPILMELTRSIPIVTPSGTAPVERGYAESLARPGRNVTGFATIGELSVVGKMLQTLKEIAPPDNVARGDGSRQHNGVANQSSQRKQQQRDQRGFRNACAGATRRAFRQHRLFVHRPARSIGPPSNASQAPHDIYAASISRNRRPDELRGQLCGCVSSDWRVHGPHSQRREAHGLTGRAVEQVRPSH